MVLLAGCGQTSTPVRNPSSLPIVALDQYGLIVAHDEAVAIMPGLFIRQCYSGNSERDATFSLIKSYLYDAFMWGKLGSVSEPEAIRINAQLFIQFMYLKGCVSTGLDESNVRASLGVIFQRVYNKGRVSE